MRLATIHRRLTSLMALSGVVAFAAGAGFEPLSAIPAGAVLLAALFWIPSPATLAWIERLVVPLSIVLVVRAGLVVAVFGGDLVVPVVDLLLLLLCFEVIRTADGASDVRPYALTFALVLASTAYRPGALFALAFLAFVVLGSITLAIGLLRRKSLRFAAPDARLDGSFLLTSLALSLVTFATAVVVFVAFPRVSQTWPGRGDSGGTSVAGFSDRISLGQHGATILGNPEVVLQVEFPGGRPDDLADLRWRGRSFDRFDGVVWTRSRTNRPSSTPTTWHDEAWPDSLITQRITAIPLDVDVIFGLHPILAVEPQSSLTPIPDNVGDWDYWGSPPRPTYTTTSLALQPDADALRRAAGNYFPDRDRYLQLPDLPPRIRELADSLTAPHDNRYDRVAAVHRYLTTRFGYTRDLPRTAGETSIDHFLFERREGHCEYFSSAMVVLLRSAGIHARNVNGFLGGEWNEIGDFLSVTQNAAHSWVEVWFPGYGWIEWDPTPPGAGAGAGTGARGLRLPGAQWFGWLSYRWNQWVLEYDLAVQIGVFDRIGEWIEGDGGAGPGLPTGWWTWLLGAGAVLTLTTVLVTRGPPRRLRPESRVWMSFMRRAVRSGLVEDERTTPGAMLARLERERPDALPAARSLSDLYQSLRFGEFEPDASDLARLRSALVEAKRALS